MTKKTSKKKVAKKKTAKKTTTKVAKKTRKSNPNRGAKKGERRGGRQKGTPNKKTLEVLDKLEKLGCDPIEGMARIAMGNIPCNLCKETGVITEAQFYKALHIPVPASRNEDGEVDIGSIATASITCPVCGGTKIEPVETKLRGDMFKELAQYVAPKRKAIEIDAGNIGTLVVIKDLTGG